MPFTLLLQIMWLLKLVQLRYGVAIGGRRLTVREVLVQDRVLAILLQILIIGASLNGIAVVLSVEAIVHRYSVELVPVSVLV